MHKYLLSITLLANSISTHAMESPQEALVATQGYQVESQSNGAFRALTESIAFKDARRFAHHIDTISHQISASDLKNAYAQAHAQTRSGFKTKIPLPLLLGTGTALPLVSAGIGIADKDPGLINSGAPIAFVNGAALLTTSALKCKPRTAIESQIIRDTLDLKINPEHSLSLSPKELAQKAIKDANAPLLLAHSNQFQSLNSSDKKELIERLKTLQNRYMTAGYIVPAEVSAIAAGALATFIFGAVVDDKELMMGGAGMLGFSALVGATLYGLEIQPRNAVHYGVMKEFLETTSVSAPLLASSSNL